MTEVAVKKRFSYEKQVIDPILLAIKKHQVYLTQSENLPQLAKLGYMYNTLWYNGRICWGDHKPAIKKLGRYGHCTDNPKYYLEACDPINEEIDYLIYDAWGMHVTEGGERGDTMHPTWDDFKSIVLESNKEYTDLEKLLRKPNKTFDEWVEAMTNPEYRYVGLFPNRKAVANYFLMSYGTGYGYSNGYIIKEASGADQDEAIYGLWENAVFHPDIQKVVDKIMSLPEVEQTITKGKEYIDAIITKKEEDDPGAKLLDSLAEAIKKIKGESIEKYKTIISNLKGLGSASTKYLKLIHNINIEEENEEDEIVPYKPYSGIAMEYSIINQLDENSHPSYIKAGIEICEDILAHREEELKSHSSYRDALPDNGKSNVAFAEYFLAKFKK